MDTHTYGQVIDSMMMCFKSIEGRLGFYFKLIHVLSRVESLYVSVTKVSQVTFAYCEIDFRGCLGFFHYLEKEYILSSLMILLENSVESRGGSILILQKFVCRVDDSCVFFFFSKQAVLLCITQNSRFPNYWLVNKMGKVGIKLSDHCSSVYVLLIWIRLYAEPSILILLLIKSLSLSLSGGLP